MTKSEKEIYLKKISKLIKTLQCCNNGLGNCNKCPLKNVKNCGREQIKICYEISQFFAIEAAEEA